MLQEKYAPALQIADRLGMQQKEVSEEEGQLKWRGAVHSALEKNQIWDAIKAVGGDSPTDIKANISVDETIPSPYPTHEVAAGETLSKIAKQHLGEARAYMRIFELNQDQLSDPDKIRVGQVLKIPV